MGTYWTTALPCRSGAVRRWGKDDLGSGALLSRACAAADPAASILLAFDAPLQERPPNLLEIGRCEDAVWVAESLPAGAIALSAVLAAARAGRHRIPTELCAGFVRQLCTALAQAPVPHLRLWPDNVFLVDGAPHLVGFGWAEKLPVPDEATSFLPQTPFGDRRDDAFSAAAIGCALASLSLPAPGAWEALPAPVRECLLRASEGHGSPGKIDPARLGRDLDELMARIHLRGPAEALSRFVDSLRVPPLSQVDGEGRFMTLAPDDCEAVRWRPPDGPALRPDGTLDRPLRGEAPGGGVSPAMFRSPSFDAPLELDLPAPAPPPPRTDRPKRFQRPFALPNWAFWLVGVAIAAAVAAVVVSLGSEKPFGMLLIESEPEGAEVWLGDENLGTTPYAGDNDLAPGTYKVRVELRGYRRYEAEIQGGQAAHLKARLIPTKGLATPAP